MIHCKGSVLKNALIWPIKLELLSPKYLLIRANVMAPKPPKCWNLQFPISGLHLLLRVCAQLESMP